ncbi:SusC/RagA family TonB-linked outer membrane protein [Arachidicoccus sp.]|uniref:SusC/RagA family TonB-linked outer membrane protein n=1 Tax=Arachidicoccus sp. TaxID=1872624 RepID=UPI003D19A8D4
MKKNILFIFLLCFTTVAFAQKGVVSGHVTNEKGQPLDGVSVKLKQMNIGTLTDASGNFTLNLSKAKVKNPTLVFTYTGYSDQSIIVESDNQKILIVLKQSTNDLNDVVVIGYGTISRKDLTGAVSSVTAKQLKDIPINSAEEALAGRLAGVQVTGSEGSPNAEVSIRVRGGGSITQDNSPLYVVDGMIEDNALSTLSPQDIETIDVLKDASATAIYGARGANGVVIITTKNGQPGHSTVTYNGFVGWQQVNRKLDVMDPYDFVFYQYERSRGNSTLESGFTTSYGNFADIDLYKNAPAVNWQDQVFGRSAFMQTHNVSVSGGDSKTQFDLSLSDNEAQAVMIGSDYNRKLVNFRLTHKVTDKLKVGFNVKFNNQSVDGQGTSNPGSSGLNFLRQAVRYIPYLAPGQSVSYYDPELLDNTSGNGLYIVNPLLLINAQYRKQYQTRINLSGYADWTITKFLSFRTTAGYDYYPTKTNSFDDSITSNAISNGNGMPIATIATTDRYTFDNSNVFTLTNRQLGGAFNKSNKIDWILGEESYQVQNESQNTVQRFFPLGTTASEALGNLNLASPPIGYAEPLPTTNQDEQRISSFFTRVNYAFQDKYLASLSMRADGSSVFSPENHWGYFPSASLAWRISKEKFMQSLKPVISDMKLRLSYGEAGNNRIPSFLYLTQFSTSSNYYGLNNQLSTAFGPVGLVNSHLKWESNISRNIGLDISFLRNRIQLTTDYYRNKTKDLLVNVTVPTTSGYEKQYQNVGATSNNGLEVQLNATIIENKNFLWSANFNISTNQNKVLSLGGEQYFTVNSGWAGSANPDDFIVKVGAPVGSMYGLVNDGFYTVDDFDYDPNNTKQPYTLKAGVVNDSKITGTPQPGTIKFKDLNGDSIVDLNNDRKIIGNANPKFFGGLNQQFVYKNFDMSIFLNFQVGNDIVNDNKLEFSSGYTVGANLLAIDNNRWKTVNPQGQVVTDPTALAALNKNATLWQPMTTGSSWTPQSWAIENGSFLRINNITLGYTLPKSLLSKVGIKKFRVYGTLNNLAVITGYSGYDPEVNTRRSVPMTPGVDYSAYPRARSFIFGVNVTL